MPTANITWSYSMCYCIYFAIIWLVQSGRSQQLFSPTGKPAAQPAKLLWLHAAGIFWLGLVPLTVANPVINTMVETSDTRFVLMASFLAALLLAVYMGARDARKFTFSPTPRAPYPKSFYRRYLALRIPFLISYELFFRGHLLFFNQKIWGYLQPL